MILCPASIRAASGSTFSAALTRSLRLYTRKHPQNARAASETLVNEAMGSRGRIIRDSKEAYEVAANAKRIAVLGIKTESQASQPAYYVPDYLQSAGIEVIPVPVYYPEVTHILGAPAVRDMKLIAEPVDVLVVFRRPQDLPPHLSDMLALKPKVVWLQSGISHPEVEASLAEASIDVVVSRCMMVDHRAAVAARSAM